VATEPIRSARRAGVLGSPIGHSLSPVLHRAAYAALGLDGWSYDAYEVDEAGLAGWLARLDPSWAGLSLTMPLKRAILPHLSALSPLAAEVGVVNTVLVRGDGRLDGDNTDVHGIVTALREAGAGAAGRAHVLGAGATACSALAALRRLGCRAPVVHARSVARAAELEAAGRRMGVRVELSGFDRLPQRAAEITAADVVITTLPAGAADDLAALLLRDGDPPAAVLLDVVYRPWPTVLAAAWAGAGGQVAGGLAMLVHQAAAQVRLMTGRTPPVAAMRAAGEAAMAPASRGGPSG